MKLSVKDVQGRPAGEVELTVALVEDGRGTQAVHDTVVAFRAAQRSGTACTKTVGDVAGTNKKPWKQKGTGRARAGFVEMVGRKIGDAMTRIPSYLEGSIGRLVTYVFCDDAKSSRNLLIFAL